MAVYVDDANTAAVGRNGARVHTSRWSHLMARTSEVPRVFLGWERTLTQGICLAVRRYE